MIQGIFIILLFVVIAALMMTKKLPTAAALPLLAIVICLIAGVPFMGKGADGKEIGFLTTVLEAGSTRMGAAIMAVIFGAWLGQLMNKTGVTETMIKKSAELGGDKPLLVTFLLALVTALLFTTLNGLGSIIMVGSIVLPILLSVGIPALSAAAIFLMAFTTGLTFNIANWQSFSKIFNLSIDQIKRFEVYMLIATAIATLILILIEFKRSGVKFACAAPTGSAQPPKKSGTTSEGQSDTWVITGFRGAMAMLTPLIPIVLVAIVKIPVVPAFLVGIIWIILWTAKRYGKAMNLFVKTCYDGITDSGPAIILMIGIGMLYLAVTHPVVKTVLNPFLLAATPKSQWAFMLFFALLAPLSLYRGPLNLFGLGSGIAALVMGLNTLPQLSVMGAFLSSERIQSCGDPTNTQNVWTANFVETDVNAITKRLLPYLWAVAVVGVIISGIIYF